MIPLRYKRIFDSLRSLAPLSEHEFSELVPLLKDQSYEKGEKFCKPGEMSDRVGFVLTGLFRVYYLGQEGEVHVRNFCAEDRLLGSFATILAAEPAHVCIEALEASRVATLSYRSFERLFEKGAVWERVGRKIAESHYVSRERREFQLLTMDAAERYQAFLRDFPGLEERITQINVAAYLGVSPVTLSRLKAKRIR